MSAQPELGPVVKQWLEKAEHDLLNAEHTLTLKENCPLDTVCFHAQQCAEKYLKGFLAWLSVGIPKTHDLRILMQLCAEKTSSFLEMNDVLVLNRYTIEARYPGDWEPLSREEAEKAVSIAKDVRKAVREQLSL